MDWNALGTLYWRMDKGSDLKVRHDPLHILIMTARQGHEGLPEDMYVIMDDGARCGPEDIQRLAVHPDRPKPF